MTLGRMTLSLNLVRSAGVKPTTLRKPILYPDELRMRFEEARSITVFVLTVHATLLQK